MSERAHLSIGEVLNLLQDEFPDITISKIRFLESQGLLDPERTPSGYRKFYDDDIARLRWILQQQREHFLPLKVIKDRLGDTSPSNGEGDDDIDRDDDQDHDGGVVIDLQVGDHEDRDDEATAHPVAGVVGGNGNGTYALDASLDGDITLHGVPTPLDPPSSSEAPQQAGDTVTAPSAHGEQHTSAEAIFNASSTSMSLNIEELARATGLTPRQIGELERFGLIEGEQFGSATRYDEEALIVARVAASMLDRGVEVRHLRMFKLAAEREAAFYEQLVTPILKQRSPQARQEALDTLRLLASGGDALRTAMLRSALKHLVQRG